MFERLVSRILDASTDYDHLSTLLKRASQPESCLIQQCPTCIHLDTKCDCVVEGIEGISRSLREQADQTSIDLLESLKTYRDVLVGYQLLLHRREMAIPQLALAPVERRISVNKNKIVEMTARGIGQRDVDKVAQTIDQVSDRTPIFSQIG